MMGSPFHTSCQLPLADWFTQLSGSGSCAKYCCIFFTDGVVAITLFLLVAGTNYFQLTAFDGAMPHNYLFTLFALIVWFTIRWHERPQWKYAIFLGLICGLATLVRPTAIIIVLVPLLWGVSTGAGWRKKISFTVSHLQQVLVAMAAMALVSGQQMLFWKI